MSSSCPEGQFLAKQNYHIKLKRFALCGLSNLTMNTNLRPLLVRDNIRDILKNIMNDTGISTCYRNYARAGYQVLVNIFQNPKSLEHKQQLQQLQ